MNFNRAEFYRSYGLFSQIPMSDRLEIAFAGRSNVGKSSLINKVFNRKSLARVSSVPGKTATINFYTIENIYMVDLPGYGYAKIAKSEKDRWSSLIEGYLTADRDIALIFQLVDMRHPPSKDDIHMINFMIDNELPFAIVLTKSDKLSDREKEERRNSLKAEIPFIDEIKVIEFSSVTGQGTDEIRNIIEEISQPDEEENEND